MKEKTLNDSNVELGRILSTKRNENKLSQEQLVRQLQLLGCDISRETLSKIESGKRQLYAIEMFYFSVALEINLNELFNEWKTKK